MSRMLTAFLIFLCISLTVNGAPLSLDKIQLPPGFHITLLTDKVPGARQMALGDDGTLFVGTRTVGSVYALQLDKHFTSVKRVYTLLKNRFMPNGVAFRDGNLYIAEVNQILRLDAIEKHLAKPPKPVVIYNQFPSNVHHGWKYIAFGPDGYLYVPVGAPCNVCFEKNPVFASITRLKPDGSDFQIYAKGVRNSVGFAWHPQTHELWFTDNGRDWLGDNIPPDELNRAPEPGLHFGFPFYYGDNQPDPEFGKIIPPGQYEKPVQKLGPHVAALGMIFYTGKQFPQKYQQHIFIAEHGSWNRSKKIGYRISLVTLKNNQATSYKPFASGWLQGEKSWGRPVALLQLPDGSLLVSDDQAGAIYKISYKR